MLFLKNDLEKKGYIDHLIDGLFFVVFFLQFKGGKTSTKGFFPIGILKIQI
jgi:hypothetical protein